MKANLRAGPSKLEDGPRPIQADDKPSMPLKRPLKESGNAES